MEDIRRLEIVEREGQTMAMLIGIVVAVVGMILLFVSFLVVTLVRGALPFTNLTDSQTQTLSTLDTGVQNNFSMLNIVILVGIVVTLIGSVVGIIFLLKA